MTTNELKLNPDKPEFILLGNKSQRERLVVYYFLPVDILGSVISPTDKARNLGVIVYSDFSFSSHIASVCRSYFVGIRDIRRIIRHLTRNIAVIVANALVRSKLDYCNSLFRSLSCCHLKKLQCVQNTLARITKYSSKFSHITPVLIPLHWLPVRHRIRFKTASVIY